MQGNSLFRSSGDLLADRRYGMAREFRARGDASAAIDLLQQALERAPGFASAWFDLGDAREEAGDREGAADAFRRALATDPSDRHGARLRLVRLGAAQAAMSEGYVRAVFDQYAPRFDEALAALSYRAPALLVAAVESVCRDQGQPMHFHAMLDLGCGTGLAGAAFRSFVERLEGVDLSPGMVAQAQRKGLYDRLAAGDLMAELAAQPAGGFDLVIAADVFVYCADLVPVVRAVAPVLKPGGLFAFTVETHPGDGVLLGGKLRYAHGERHVREALAAAGLRTFRLSPATSRTEGGEPVAGLLALAGHASASPLSARL